MTTNSGVAFYKYLPVSDPDSFQDLSLPMPTPGPKDLLVQVQAVSLNPVDSKFRQGVTSGTTVHVSGYDAVGTVTACGSEVTGFTPGDRVAYSGSSQRPGSEQRYQCVDYRLAAQAPASISDRDLAALPLVTITAWELLFDKMGFTPRAGANQGKKLLIINGAGGVGSILGQLAKWAGLTVSATAGPQHQQWITDVTGAQSVDYHADIEQQLAAQEMTPLDGIAILYAPEPYMALAGKLIAPFGHIGTIVLPQQPLDVAILKNKAASLDFEYMFARSDNDVAPERQGQILAQVFALFAAGKLHSITSKELSPINADSVRAGTALVESGHGSGKVVITGGFED
ncbi:zinc-binding alcohol dehydrogenase family protein [Lacticaseibacillus zhaodongensis]|uniref:zinc-binding alcohol dehydrogenase family protein n=1 Tax=Lacticaseibacillus zhaodongensis TaxID=2668065 RepID=UPI0012D2A6E0|nr:zinc-binding alcohol dehydrogenase family protein [Lacticaseibacillus zhaodongensis]